MLRIFFIACSYAVFFTINVAAADLSKISKLDGFVSIEDALSRNADKPFECTDYVEASQSCAAVSKSQIHDNTLISANEILISEAPRIKVNTKATLELAHGLACGTAATWDIAVVGEAVNDEFEKGIINAIRASVKKFGKTCVAYFEKGNLLQAVNFSAETGKVIEEIPIRNTTFWDVAPRLRAAEQS